MTHIKRISLVLIFTLILTVLFSCNGAKKPNGSVTNTSGDYAINGEPLAITALADTVFEFDGLPSFAFVFSIPTAQLVYIESECTDLEFSATVHTDDGGEYIASVNEIDAYLSVARFAVSVGTLFKKDYFTNYSATLTLSFTDEGGNPRTFTAKSGTENLYGAAYRAYCDRSSTRDGIYLYPVGDGFSPYEDLSHQYAVLTTALHVNIGTAGVSNVYENEFYLSPYVTEFFDGVLKVSMKNGGPINAEMLDKIFVNGESIYFEIHNGIIRVLLEVE